MLRKLLEQSHLQLTTISPLFNQLRTVKKYHCMFNNLFDIHLMQKGLIYSIAPWTYGVKQHESIGKEEIENCAFEGLEDNEEGIPYVMGNTLWAFYQFSVLIVLLSVLRARMVNTYHRIFKEADVQWKFFRFVILPVHDIKVSK